MTSIQQGIIALLKSAVTGQALPLPEDFDLEQALPLIRKNNITALAFEGAACCGIDRGTPAMGQLFRGYCRMLQHSEGQLRQLEGIFRAFEAAGIDYLPLKGVNMKPLYPKPELRYMGDADILIRQEQYHRIRPIMETLGFAEQGENDHELNWQHPQLHLELHRRLMPTYEGDYHVHFADTWQMAQRLEGSRFCLPPEEEWVFQFVHFAKHFRESGIGCRYVLDLWMYLRAHPQMDWDVVEARLAPMGLSKFHGYLLSVIRAWFADGPLDPRGQVITELIFDGGSWGSQTTKLLSHTMQECEGGGRVNYAAKALFPGVEVLKGKYTVLEKAPWLLPAVWVYRPFYKLFRERESLRTHARNMQTLEPEQVDQRRQLLRYLDLEYRF